MDTSTDMTFSDVPDGTAAMAVMGETGDTKYLWDPKVPAEVDAAREHFKAMKDKGFLVFKLTGVLRRKGKEAKRFDPKAQGYVYVAPEETKNEVAHEFDPEADRYIAVPAAMGG